MPCSPTSYVMNEKSLLQIDGLTIGFPSSGARWKRVVDRVSFQLGAGERVGIVGESGSGKSLTALACLGLVPEPGRVLEGRVIVDGAGIQSSSESELATLRGRTIGIVLQEAADALNPVYSVGFQIAETIAIHGQTKNGDRLEAATRLLEEVSVDDPRTVMGAYPHELSGGLAQRVMLALALAGGPKILIADEPTSALDLITQKEILDLLNRLCTDHDLGLVLISHDLTVIEEMVDRVLVMYRGSMLEEAPREELFSRPRHPYTRYLLASAPGSKRRAETMQNDTAHGRYPATTTGCRFHPGCPFAADACRITEPELTEVEPLHFVRCPLPEAHGGDSHEEA